MNIGQKIGYQKTWHVQVPGLRLIDFTTDRRGIVTYSNDFMLRLFDQGGRELWSYKTEFDLFSVSIADTLEVLTVDADKHISLFRNDGAVLWRRRPFPAVYGKISASGENFAFITSDPAVIGTGRMLRTDWSYRNLMRRPDALAISPSGNTVAFPCRNDMGEGLGAVNSTGRPYAPFMGIDRVKSVDLDETGEILLAIDVSGSVFCMNIVKTFGVWKGQLDPSFVGINLSGSSGEAIAYSNDGRIAKLDSKGTIIWDYRFTEPLMSAFISSDGQSIYYATTTGELGCLMESSGSSINRMEFLEIEVKNANDGHTRNFRKIWNREMPASSRQALPWKGQDGVEYCLVTSGSDSIACINDLGEEVWQSRAGGGEILDISVAADADTAVIITSSGALGIDLSGSEMFRFCGAFRQVLVFDSGSFLIIDEVGAAQFYDSSNHFLHNVPLESVVEKLYRFGSQALLVTHNSLHLIDEDGNTLAQDTYEHDFSCVSVDQVAKKILCGDKSGKLMIFNSTLNQVFSYGFDTPVAMIGCNMDANILAVVLEKSDEILILKRLTGEIMRNNLTGRPIQATCLNDGFVLATDLDQLGFVSFDGQILGRYTAPYQIIRILPCHRKNSVLLLTEDSLVCITASEGHSGPNATLGYIEI